MNVRIKQIIHGALAAVLAALSATSLPVSADDTEIYLGDDFATNPSRPNILFVLDESGSMAWSVSRDYYSTPAPVRMNELKAALRELISTVDNVNIGLMSFTANTNAPVRYPMAYVNEEAYNVESNFPLPTFDIKASADDAMQSADGSAMDIDSTALSLGSTYDTPPQSLSIQISNNGDDAEQEASDGDMSVDGSILSVPYSGNTRQVIGFRFRDVDIPRSSDIQSANIHLRSYSQGNTKNNKTPVHISIYVDNADDPEEFFSWDDYNLSERTLTGVSPVQWPNIETKGNGDLYVTPELSPLLSYLTSQANWNDTGEDVVFVFDGSGSETRNFYSRDNYSQNAAILNVTYLPSTATSSRKVTGLRFNQLSVPQGATINSVKLVVTAADNSSDAMDVTIHGEDVDQATAFEETLNNIGARTKTAASANWTLSTDPSDNWNQGQQYGYQSEELKNLVQEIVDREQWCGGNPLALILEANIESNRAIYGWDQGAAFAPKLEINFDSNVELVNGRTGLTNTGCTRAYISSRVNSSNDDAEELSNGSMEDMSSVDLDMGTRIVGLRFENIALPDVSVIDVEEANVTFTARTSSDSSSSTYTFYGHKVADSPVFVENDTHNISSRSKTTASADWTVSSSLSQNASITSADISTVVEEVVGVSGWNDSGVLTLIVNTSGNNRELFTYDGSNADAPLLSLTVKYNRAGEILPPVYSARSRMLEVVDQLTPSGSTPLVDAYYEAVQYFRGGPVEYGATRDSSSVRRVSHPDSYTGGTVSPANCSDSSSSGCKSETISGDAVYTSPITDTCAQNHIVLLTDGAATELSSTSDIRALLQTEDSTATCASTPNNGNEACGRELSRFIAENDQSDLAGDQKIITHTIAFALQDANAKTFLADLATKQNENSNVAGKALTATNADELIDAFQTIIRQVAGDPASFAAPSLSINSFNRFFNGDDIFFSFFEPSTRPLWEGNIKRFKLCSDPETQSCSLGELMYYEGGSGDLIPAVDPETGRIREDAYSVWSSVPDGATVPKGGAGEHVPDPDDRVVYTYLGADKSPSVAVNLRTDSGKNHKIAVANTDLTKEHFNVGTVSERDDLIAWMRGTDIDDAYEDSAVRWRVADPLHSSPVAINYAVSGNEAVTKLVVGTNDGGIRMLNAKTGVEEWIFYPPEVLDRQSDARQNVGATRFYGVDGTPSVRVYDKHKDGLINPTDGDYVHLYIGMRRGGNHYYALDITPASPLTYPGAANAHNSIDPKFMWSITGGNPDPDTDTDFERLGDTWSKPSPARIRMQNAGGTTIFRDVLIFGGGYDVTLDANYAPQVGSASQGNAIFIVDAFTGELIWSASSDSSATTQVTGMDYSIPSDVALFDSDGDAYTDRIYVADIGGQLWRVDIAPNLKDGAAGDTKVGKLAELSDLTSPFADADKRRFFYPPDIVEVLDTTYSGPGASRYNLLLLSSGNRAKPLDRTVQDRIYAIRDYHVGAMPGSGYTINAANLVDVTDNLLQDGTTEDIRSDALDELKDPTTVGWYFDLEEDGEKGLAPGTTLEGIFFVTTYLPDAVASGSACTLNDIGAGRLYAVNILNGVAVYPWNETTEGVTKADRYMEAGGLGGIPPEFVPVFQEKGVTGCVGTNCGIDTDIKLPRYRSYWSESINE